MRKLLVRLYPRAWRERYGDELLALLEDLPVAPATVLDLLHGAATAHWRGARAWASELRGPNRRRMLWSLIWNLVAVAVTLAIFAVATTTFGNLAAYGQTNLKRLLAYSTIAHAGFMMMGLATLTREGAGAMLFYLIVYLFMNLGAFTVVAFLPLLPHHSTTELVEAIRRGGA